MLIHIKYNLVFEHSDLFQADHSQATELNDKILSDQGDEEAAIDDC
jgi:hypothetical protein